MVQRAANFKRSKAALLEKMPLPRRKKWWEKLAENQHDHLYDEAEEIFPSVPPKYQPIYRLIIDQRLMQNVLVIQRYVKKRGLEQWLIEQNPENRNWKNQNFVKVRSIDTLGDEARST